MYNVLTPFQSFGFLELSANVGLFISSLILMNSMYGQSKYVMTQILYPGMEELFCVRCKLLRILAKPHPTPPENCL